jgi:GNAT superfamily N-acetyltransferase
MRYETTIGFKRLQPEDFEQVKLLSVGEEQVRYVGTPHGLLENACETSHYHFIVKDGQTVGFFNIDTVYDKTYEFTVPGELGLRAFFIDRRFQRRGLGKASAKALRSYLAVAYPGRPSIALTVNCHNPGAYQVYLQGGFVDTGELYHGGKAGPQHIMRMKIE